MSHIDYTRLMIGDILMATYDDGEKVISFPVVVDGIDENGTLVDGDCYISWHPLLPEHKDIEYADELAPIPLTEEILKAKGFARKPLLKRWIIDGELELIEDSMDNTKLEYWFSVSVQYICLIHYVHQLQHALRLCGLNELADNFKTN